MATSKAKKHIRVAKPPYQKDEEHFEGNTKTKMRIIGVGGGGSNIVSEISQRLKKADFVAANTDLQALKSMGRNAKRFAFGLNTAKGLGCGMDAGLAQNAALEDREKIKRLLEGQDLTVLIATLGGGTGSGAIPVFAEVAHEAKSLTIGIFTLPFGFEGEKRNQVAQAALEKLKSLVNVYVVIPNDSIFKIVEKDVPLKFALSAVNKRLSDSLEGFVETLFLPGLINIDFADVKAVLQGKSRLAYLSSATFTGPDRAKLALDDVLANPLHEYHAKGAERILFNITGSKDMKMHEVSEISKTIGLQNPRAKIIFGISTNPKFAKKLRITIFAIGCQSVSAKRSVQKSLPIAKSQKETKPKQKKVIKARKEKRVEAPKLPILVPFQEKQRRNALDVKKAIDEAIEDLQEEEQKWDIPAFLRYKKLM